MEKPSSLNSFHGIHFPKNLFQTVTNFMSKSWSWLKNIPSKISTGFHQAYAKCKNFADNYFKNTRSVVTDLNPKEEELKKETRNIKIITQETLEKFEEGTCENFLRTEMFKPWLEGVRNNFNNHSELKQFKEAVEKLETSELKSHLQALVEHLDSEPKDENSESYIYDLSHNRTYYKKLIELMRGIDTALDQYSDKTSAPYTSAQKFVHEFFEKFFLAEHVSHGMEMLYSHGLEKEISLEEMSKLPEKIQEANKKLTVNTRKPDYKGVFDPVLLGNISYINFKCAFKGSKEIPIVRCPNLVSDRKDPQDTKKTLHPMGEQYLRFLKAYEQNGRKHLYVNMMNRTTGNEKTRSEAIENTEQKHSSAIAITLDRNSSFYMNGGNGDNATQFKQEFLSHLFTSSYYWTKNIETSEWKKDVENLIGLVHQDYFDKKSSLSKEERVAFIELTYMAIIDTVSKKLDPDSANYSCKNCIDRGELTQATMYLFQKTRSGKDEIGQEDLNRLIEILFLPALLVGDKVIDPRYLERFDAVAKVMLQKRAEGKAVMNI